MSQNEQSLKAQITELESENKRLKSRKKYGLVWEQKNEDVVLQCKEKLPVLQEVVSKEIKSSEEISNILIEGDNYHALSVLNYTHHGKIDVIYIDPPYNTGARDWKYNNNYVDDSDSFRHSKWISFMHSRLSLARNLLSEKGIICVTIDDNELPRLWLLMESIFGENNHLGTISIRINPGGRKSKRKVALQHEYALFFSKNSSTKVAPFYVDPQDKTHKFYKGEDGKWYEERNLRKEGQDSLATKKDGSLSNRYYPIYFDPKTNEISVEKKLKETILPIDTRGQKRIWRRGKEDIKNLFRTGNLQIKKTRNGFQLYFKFATDLEGETPKSFWDNSKYSASEHGTGTLDEVMGVSASFQFPKSPYAVMDCIKVCSNNKEATVLDFFAGSGTTGHAVMMLNKEDNGSRQFILCTNNENKIAEEVTYPRIKKVISGVKGAENITGIKTNLKYFKTDFISSDATDKNKKELVDKSTEMLCLKENCFFSLKQSRSFKIFHNNKNKHLGIVYGDSGIEKIKEIVRKLNKKIIVYMFSLDDSTREEEFAEVKNLVELRPIPTAILNVYKRIFK